MAPTTQLFEGQSKQVKPFDAPFHELKMVEHGALRRVSAACSGAIRGVHGPNACEYDRKEALHEPSGLEKIRENSLASWSAVASPSSQVALPPTPLSDGRWTFKRRLRFGGDVASESGVTPIALQDQRFMAPNEREEFESGLSMNRAW